LRLKKEIKKEREREREGEGGVLKAYMFARALFFAIVPH
jgi:hypothetical protein